MESIQEFLNITLITIAGYNVTLAEVLYVPTLLIVGYVLVRWLVMTVTKTLSRTGGSPDAVQIVRRARR
jgi:hypothetical protein